MAKKRIWKYLKNKYVITSIAFLFFLLLLSQNNLIGRADAIHELNKLKKQKAYYEAIISQNTKKINELQTNRDNLEKFAREEYLMKKDQEDIFVIVEEGE